MGGFVGYREIMADFSNFLCSFERRFIFLSRKTELL
jgi:hypothetical protein